MLINKMVFRSQGKIYYLEAQDKHTMLYWLQELQKRRRHHSQRKTRDSAEQAKVLAQQVLVWSYLVVVLVQAFKLYVCIVFKSI